ncbi:MAG: hypothetical protein ABI999_16510 [Acidobacteriota bacterium]
MKELFLIVFVIVFLGGLTLIRYRKGIMAVIRVSRMVKQASVQGTSKTNRQIKTNEPSPLVKCSRCGTWVPQERARKIGSSLFYCSSECVEMKAR